MCHLISPLIMKPSLTCALLLTLLPYAALAADPSVPYADIEPRAINAEAPASHSSIPEEVVPVPSGSVLDDFAFANKNQSPLSKDDQQSQGQINNHQGALPHLEGF